MLLQLCIVVRGRFFFLSNEKLQREFVNIDGDKFIRFGDYYLLTAAACPPARLLAFSIVVNEDTSDR